MAKKVTRSSPTQEGKLYGQLNNGVKIVNAYNMGLDDLTDTNITSPEKNDLFYYDGNSWINKPVDEVMRVYTWVLDGGDSVEEIEPDPEPTPEPQTYAEMLSARLLEIINSAEFQSYVTNTQGLEAVSMNANNVTIAVSEKFEGLFDYFYNDDEISFLMGKIITAIYDNISGGIRQVLDNIDTDVWLTFKTAESGEVDEFKLFVYFSDESVVFYNIKVYYQV